MANIVLDLRADAPAQTFAEYQPAARKYFNDQEITDKMRLEVKMYADEVGKYDLNVMRNHLIARGAKEVDIIISEIQRPI
jgi:hypothetical protein